MAARRGASDAFRQERQQDMASVPTVAGRNRAEMFIARASCMAAEQPPDPATQRANGRAVLQPQDDCRGRSDPDVGQRSPVTWRVYVSMRHPLDAAHRNFPENRDASEAAAGGRSSQDLAALRYNRDVGRRAGRSARITGDAGGGGSRPSAGSAAVNRTPWAATPGSSSRRKARRDLLGTQRPSAPSPPQEKPISADQQSRQPPAWSPKGRAMAANAIWPPKQAQSG